MSTTTRSSSAFPVDLHIRPSNEFGARTGGANTWFYDELLLKETFHPFPELQMTPQDQVNTMRGVFLCLEREATFKSQVRDTIPKACWAVASNYTAPGEVDHPFVGLSKKVAGKDLQFQEPYNFKAAVDKLIQDTKEDSSTTNAGSFAANAMADSAGTTLMSTFLKDAEVDQAALVSQACAMLFLRLASKDAPHMERLKTAGWATNMLVCKYVTATIPPWRFSPQAMVAIAQIMQSLSGSVAVWAHMCVLERTSTHKNSTGALEQALVTRLRYHGMTALSAFASVDVAGLEPHKLIEYADIALTRREIDNFIRAYVLYVGTHEDAAKFCETNKDALPADYVFAASFASSIYWPVCRLVNDMFLSLLGNRHMPCLTVLFASISAKDEHTIDSLQIPSLQVSSRMTVIAYGKALRDILMSGANDEYDKGNKVFTDFRNGRQTAPMPQTQPTVPDNI